MMLKQFAVYAVKTWEFMEFQLDLLLIFIVIMKTQQDSAISQ